MRYLFRNLCSLVRHELLVFCLMIACIGASSIVIHVSYGLYQDSRAAKTASVPSYVTVVIKKPEQVTKGKLLECLYGLPEDTKAYVKNVLTHPIFEEYRVSPFGERAGEAHFTVSGTSITACDIFAQNVVRNGFVKGEFLTPEQEESGALVALIASDEVERKAQIIFEDENGQRFVTVRGKEYKVIGSLELARAPYVPFASLEDDTQLEGAIYAGVGNNDAVFQRKHYEILTAAFRKTFGDSIEVKELHYPDEMNLSLYVTLMLLSIAVAFLAAVNFSVLYRYILNQRKKRLAIFRICGCTRLRAVGLFIGECLVVILPVYAGSVFLFAKLLLPTFAKTYVNMEAAFVPSIYAFIFAVDIGVSLVVLLRMICASISKYRILEDAKEGGK